MQPGPSQLLAAGTMIGEYRVTDVLGAGGFGVVYAAVQPEIGKQVAIKVLREEAARIEEVSTRFKNEARAVNEINHPNIIDIFSFGVLPGTDVPYFVMEYLKGTSLAELVGPGRSLSPARIVELMEPVASAVDAAHQKGIVHRDLKPENIFLDESSGTTQVKVLDFGVAKFQSMSTQLTGRGETLGTWLYMSPEQCAGDEVTGAADVYSFGVLVFHALTGRFPVEGQHPMALMSKHLKHERTLPSAFGAPPELDAAIMACLESAPEQRYETLTLAHRALASAVDDLGEHAGLAPDTVRDAAPRTSSATAFAATHASDRNATALPLADTRLSDASAPAATSRRALYVGLAALVAAALGVTAYMMLRGGDGASTANTAGARPAPADAGVAGTVSTSPDAAPPDAAIRLAAGSKDAGLDATPPPKPNPKLPRRLIWENHRFQSRYSAFTVAMRNCRRNADPTGPKGQLRIQLAISPRGRIVDFAVLETPSASIALCAQREARRIRFPRSQLGMRRFWVNF